MSSLTHLERIKLEKLLGMSTGYVCNFSDKAFKDFILEVANVDVYAPGYDENGTSKANRLRTFWKKESDELSAKLIRGLLDYWKTENLLTNARITENDEVLYKEGLIIAARLEKQNMDHVVGGPENGVYITAKQIKNNGLITGPKVNILTETYSGNGEISGHLPPVAHKEKTSSFEKITNNQTFAFIIGGLILLIIVYMIYLFFGINLSQYR